MRVKIDNEEEFKVLEKVVRRYRFNLVDEDPEPDENNLRLEAGPSSSFQGGAKRQRWSPPPMGIEEEIEDEDYEAMMSSTKNI